MITDVLRLRENVEVIAYHDSCSDGLCAAAVAKRHCFRRCMCVPVQYQRPFAARIWDGGNALLFVDFCPEPEQLNQMLEVWKEVYVIDHHEGRQWIQERLPDHSHFALDRSGAMLTWEVFDSCPVAELVLYVQDRDLWQWKLPKSREISAALWQQDRDPATWEKLLRQFSQPGGQFSKAYLAKLGETLLRQERSQVQAMAKESIPAQLYGQPFLAVNAPVLPSETCELVLAEYPEQSIACAFRFLADGQVRLSFRAREGHQCLELAQMLGGGGHARAAGATVPPETFSRMLNLGRSLTKVQEV